MIHICRCIRQNVLFFQTHSVNHSSGIKSLYSFLNFFLNAAISYFCDTGNCQPSLTYDLPGACKLYRYIVNTMALMGEDANCHYSNNYLALDILQNTLQGDLFMKWACNYYWL